MGSNCGTLNCKTKKNSKFPNATIIKRPTPKDLSEEEDQEDQDLRIIVPPDNEDARIGVYFQGDELLKALPPSQQRKATKSSRLEKWYKMVTFGLDDDLIGKVILKKNKGPQDSITFSKYAKIGLNNFYETYPDIFLNRIQKGPPPQYRWLAWKTIASRKLKSAKGLYEELLTKGKHSVWMHDIMKDVDRTFPGHSFFSKDKYGDIGQKSLMNILSVFSVYNEKVGYCQSMNFIVGFLQLMSGGNEKECFWLFAALLATSNLNQYEPKFDGLRGFFKKDFPLLNTYVYQFLEIFREELPDLFFHFIEIGIPELLWINKWIQSLFLYSFPLGLCIRIWDNIFAQGTRFMFKVGITILKLTQHELLQLDMSGVNEVFISFKDEKCKLLPGIEVIIAESLKIKISDERLDEIRAQYKQSRSPKKQAQPKVVKLSIVKKEAIEKIEKQHYEIQVQQLKQQEEEKIMMEDIEDQQEEQQARSSEENKQIGGSSSGVGPLNADVSAGGESKSRFAPNIISYEEQSKKSAKSKSRGVQSHKNLENYNSNEEFKIQANRNSMVFNSLLKPAPSVSSEHYSITQSMQEAESEKQNREVPTSVKQIGGSSRSVLPKSQPNLINYSDKQMSRTINNANVYQAPPKNFRKTYQEHYSREVVNENSLEEVGDDEEIKETDGHLRIDESNDFLMRNIKKGFELSQFDHDQDSINHDEDRDIVQNMDQNGDQVSQSSMQRSGCHSDSNKLNHTDLLKPRIDPNSDTIISFVNKLPV